MNKSLFYEHQNYMSIALKEARKALRLDEVPVGCLIVRNNSSIITAHNQVEKHSDPTNHAEMIAIKKALKKFNTKYLDDCKIYVSLEPCPMCLSAIMATKISELYFAADDLLYGACGGKVNLTSEKLFNHKIKCFGGILEEESRTLLKSFFAKIRKHQ